MARSHHWRDFKPDYIISERAVLLNFVSHMVLVEQNFDILTLCHNAQRFDTSDPPLLDDLGSIPQSHEDRQHLDTVEAAHKPQYTTLANMPSWMPDITSEALPYLGSVNNLSEKSPLRSLMKELSRCRGIETRPINIGGAKSPTELRTRYFDGGLNEDLSPTPLRSDKSTLGASGFIVDRVSDESSILHPLAWLKDIHELAHETKYGVLLYMMGCWTPSGQCTSGLRSGILWTRHP